MVRRALIAVICLAVTCAGAAAALAASSGPGSVYGSPSVNRALAHRAAAMLLAAVPAVPGATASGDVDHALPRPSFNEATPNLVDAARWYETGLSPVAAVAQMTGRLPRWIVGRGGARTHGAVSSEWGLPATRGVTQRVVAVSATALAAGRTLVRVDGEAVWLAPRSVRQRIPSGVVSATFSGHGELPGSTSPGPSSAPVTVRGAVARALVGAVNEDPLSQPGTFNCPDALDTQIAVRFQTATGATVARLIESPTGCPTIRLTLASGAHATLSDGVPWAPGMPTRTLAGDLVAAHAVTTCPADALSMLPTTAIGHALIATVRDTSSALCVLRGIPRIALRAADGHTLIARQHPMTSDEAAPAVILYPGSTAEFSATVSSCRRATRASTALVTIPGVATPLPSAITARVTPCPGASLDVSALSADG